MFEYEMIEQAAFMYLRAMSFQSIVDILQSWVNKDVFTKRILIEHIEKLADDLPSHQEVTAWLHPKRSGYYALDGTWMKLQGQDFILLIVLDVSTLDIVSWHVAEEESHLLSYITKDAPFDATNRSCAPRSSSSEHKLDCCFDRQYQLIHLP